MADLEDDEEDLEIPEIKQEDDMDTEDVKPSKLELEQVPKGHTIFDVAQLHKSEELGQIMTKIEKFSTRVRKPHELLGPVEADPEYLLIVDANNLAAQVDNELSVIHKVVKIFDKILLKYFSSRRFQFARDIYTKRFPELESLVIQPLEYLMTAKELGNQLESVKSNDTIAQYLTQATIMVVSVTASTTQGKNLTKEELDIVTSSCEMAIDLAEKKARIFEYVESRMAFIAPNLSAIVGSNIAAKLMGAAGGLTKLSKMPANNISLLGKKSSILQCSVVAAGRSISSSAAFGW